jgi:hypothetical protein
MPRYFKMIVRIARYARPEAFHWRVRQNYRFRHLSNMVHHTGLPLAQHEAIIPDVSVAADFPPCPMAFKCAGPLTCPLRKCPSPYNSCVTLPAGAVTDDEVLRKKKHEHSGDMSWMPISSNNSDSSDSGCSSSDD